MDEYQKWMGSPYVDHALREELERIKGNDEEIKNRFYMPLQFGTAGLRGVLGAGINRMNIHTVRQATQGLAAMINENGAGQRGVAIAYDCRRMSDVFARDAARVLAANGVKVYLFDAMRPTPVLSFAILKLGCVSGINITASHNPPEYNGYKAYWEDGAQLPPGPADAAARHIRAIDIFTGVKLIDFNDARDQGIISMLGYEIDEEFLDAVASVSVSPEIVRANADKLRIVYTPFHGTGYKLVPEALKRLGVKHLYCEPSQSVPSGEFPTVSSPNPENPEGFRLAVELAKQKNADLIIGTDPDADRTGVMIRGHDGEYVTITGNQLGVMLIHYIIEARRQNDTLPVNAAVVKSIVTTELARAVAEANGVACFDTFTGFKFIANMINDLQHDGKFKYIFSFEESYGYLVGDYCRDKDAVSASLLAAEMTAWYLGRGMTLADGMVEIYEKYGWHTEKTINMVMAGADGLDRMNRLMDGLRGDPPDKIAGVPVAYVRDYLTGERTRIKDQTSEKMELFGSNVLYLELADGTAFIIRPSGTEPKVKVYILAKAGSQAETAALAEKYAAAAGEIIK